ncbi:hypothetical protein TrCOL_g12438 [Triparma columacea]|nr:hypothetical protein TrCOL_g12438 [Triparma columacea]
MASGTTPRGSNSSSAGLSDSSTSDKMYLKPTPPAAFEGLPGQKRPVGKERPGSGTTPRLSSKGRQLTTSETTNAEKLHAALRLRSSQIHDEYNKDAEKEFRKFSVHTDVNITPPDISRSKSKRGTMRRGSTHKSLFHLNLDDANNKKGGDTISMPIALLSSIMRLLGDNSSERCVRKALDFICQSCATELNCEKVDLFVISTVSKTVVPMCQGIHPNSSLSEEIAEAIGLNTSDVEFAKKSHEFLEQMYESRVIRIDENSLWGRICKGKESVFTSDDLSATELLGEDFIQIIKEFKKVNFDIRNVMAVPIHCTRNSEHLVAVLLCQNKFLDDESDTESDDGESGDMDIKNPRSKLFAPHFSNPDDTVIPKQLSQFAGIAISSLEMIYFSKSKEDRFQFLIQTVDTLASDENIGMQIKDLYLKINEHVMSDDLVLYVTIKNDTALKLVHSSIAKDEEIVKIDNNSIMGVVARTKKPVYVYKNLGEEAKEAKKSSAFVDLLESHESAVICVPVIYQDKVSAVIKASNRSHLLDNDDLDMLTMLGNSTGILLHQSHILKDAMTASRLASSAGRLAKCASSKFTSLMDIMEVVKTDAKLLVPSQRVTIYFSDFNRKELWTHLEDLNIKSENGDTGNFFRLALGEGLAGTSASLNDVVVTNNAYDESLFNKSVDATTGFLTRSVLCIPIHERGSADEKVAVGVLQIINKVDGGGGVCDFTEDDIIMLQNYASTVGAVLTPKLHDFINKKREADAIAAPKDLNTRKVLSLSQQYSAVGSNVSIDRHKSFKRTSLEMLRRENEKKIEEGTIAEETSSSSSPTAPIPYIRTSLHGKDVTVALPELRVHGISSWDFDVLDFNIEQCEAYLMFMLDQFSLVEELELDVVKTGNFVSKILETYNDVPYHNYHHATQVAHQTGWMLLRSSVNDLAALSILIAAICHDVDHPGNNNTYEIQMDSHLSRLYSDDRVLERHHSATALNILYDPGCDMLSTLDVGDVRKVRCTIVQAILSTDMNMHTDLMSSLEGLPADAFSEEDKKSDDLVYAVASMIIHSADLSTNCLSIEQAKVWGEMCLDEFKTQATKEAENGLQVTTFMTNLESRGEKAKTQFGFCSFIVKPWMKVVCSFEVFKEDFKVAVDNLNEVIKFYEEEMKQEDD